MTQSQISEADKGRIPVVNVSSRVLSNEEREILEKGPKYCFPVKANPKVMIPELENAISYIKTSDKDETRHYLAAELAKSIDVCTADNNKQLKTISKFRKDPVITITSTDKSGQIAIMNTAEYDEKLLAFIEESKSVVIKNNPTASLCAKVRMIAKMQDIPEPLKTAARTPNGACVPSLFGRLKSHKPGNKLRPIVSKRNSPTFLLEKALSKYLAPFLPESNRTLKSTEDFVERVKHLTINETDIIGSFDVVSLFPSIPVTEAVSNLVESITAAENPSECKTKAIKKAIDLATMNNYFQFRGKYYRQTAGAPMGSPVSGILAESVLRPIENLIMEGNEPKPTVWLRYVDDVFFIWTHGEENLQLFLTKLNGINTSIHFTMETENCGKLPFLDVLLCRTADGHIERSVFRKESFVPNVILKTSTTPTQYKIAAFRSYFRRAYTVCSNDRTRAKEITNIFEIGLSAGYSKLELEKIRRNVANRMNNDSPENREKQRIQCSIPYLPGFSYKVKNRLKRLEVNVTIKPNPSIMVLARKDRDRKELEWRTGVYSVPLNYPDGSVKTYIGLTKRSFGNRRKEHNNDIRNLRRSTALARASFSDNAKPVWNEMRQIAPYTSKKGTAIRETIEILSATNACNEDVSVELPRVWYKFLPLQQENQTIAT